MINIQGMSSSCLKKLPDFCVFQDWNIDTVPPLVCKFFCGFFDFPQSFLVYEKFQSKTSWRNLESLRRIYKFGSPISFNAYVMPNWLAANKSPR